MGNSIIGIDFSKYMASSNKIAATNPTSSTLQESTAPTTIENVDFSDTSSSANTSVDNYINSHGDANGDGKVDINDVSAIQKSIVGMGDVTDGKGDINGDGRVTVKDAAILQKYLGGEEIPSSMIPGANSNVSNSTSASLQEPTTDPNTVDSYTLYAETMEREKAAKIDTDNNGVYDGRDLKTIVSSLDAMDGKYTVDDLNRVRQEVLDVNKDGKIDSNDVSAIQQNIIGDREISEGIGDIDGDGKVTITDATILDKYLNGGSISQLLLGDKNNNNSNGNDPISGKFERPDTNGEIKIYDEGNITHTFTNTKPTEVSNGDYNKIYNDLGTVSFNESQVKYIPVEQGPSRVWSWNWGFWPHRNDPYADVCDTMSGCCETEDYYIVSFKNGTDTKQRIKLYDKKTFNCVREFTTDKLGHANGMTIAGDTIYVVSGTEDNGWSTVSHLKLSGIINWNAEVETETFQAMNKEGKIVDESVSGISYDPVNHETSVTAIGSDIYITDGDGKYMHTTKMNISDDDKNNGIAGTTQDLCVANNKLYVIRTKDPKVHNISSAAEGCNVIDIYDAKTGKYEGSKTIDLPGEELEPGTNAKIYRELESISYDPKTGFTLYFTTPNFGYKQLTGNATSPPHAVVTGVNLD